MCLPARLTRSAMFAIAPLLCAGSALKNISSTTRTRHDLATKCFDIIVVGGGIIGCATAREISMRHPQLKIAIVEKENKLAAHQSGHNSGVVHAGIYYTPGTLKAKLCLQGMNLAYKYFDAKKIPYKKVGKMIIAADASEVKKLELLFQRGQANGVKDLRWLDAEGIKNIEPNCRGVAAIWSPHTGIVDWAQVTRSYAQDFEESGGSVHLDFKVSAFHLDTTCSQVCIVNESTNETLRTRFVVAAAGLHSDRVAKLTGCNFSPRIVPFRGEYLLLKPEKSNLVKTNVYPVPDPSFPFLGVHFTPRMDGSVWLGPNAVLAFHREGYKQSDFNMHDTLEALSFSGLRKLATKYFRQGLNEMYRSYNMKSQVELLRRFVPSLEVGDVIRGPSGVRAQALDDSGNLVDDFVFDTGKGELGKRVLHVRNAPSPAATSSLAIAKMVADKVDKTFLSNTSL